MLIATKSAQTHELTALAEAIRNCFEGKLKQDELAAKSGIPQQTISRFARGESRPKFAQLFQIEEACGRPRGWILIQAGFVDEVTTVPDAIAVDPNLDDVGRDIVLTVYAANAKPRS